MASVPLLRSGVTQTLPVVRALPVAHALLTGHSPQRATRAVQMSAPSSMIAWLNAHAAAPSRRGMSAAPVVPEPALLTARGRVGDGTRAG